MCGTDAGDRCGGLLRGTRELVEQCTLDPAEDLGDIHVPELSVLEGSRPPAGPLDVGSVLAGYSERRRDHAQIADEARRAQVELVKRAVRLECIGVRCRHRPAPGWKTNCDDPRPRVRGYFLTVAEVVDIIRGWGSGLQPEGPERQSGQLSTLGSPGRPDPVRPADGALPVPLRRALPDIDVDVESARRPEVYERILDRFGGDRCACVSMRDTYRVRHAVQDVGTALGMPAGEVDTFAKAFPHIPRQRARRRRELPELRDSGLGRMAAEGRLEVPVGGVPDGLPRHIAVHPCGAAVRTRRCSTAPRWRPAGRVSP